MNKQVFITEDYKGYKAGQIINDCFSTANGTLDKDNNFIPKKHFVYLQEKLTSQDEARIKTLIRDLLKAMFWRIYTRTNFILK